MKKHRKEKWMLLLFYKKTNKTTLMSNSTISLNIINSKKNMSPKVTKYKFNFKKNILTMKKMLFYLLLFISLSSCKKDYNETNSSEDLLGNEKITTKEESMLRFTEILSKLVYDNKNVRTFLKEESLKKFDKNYNVLFHLVKNKNIEEKTFREMLVSISSESEISEIENNVPLLNILVPELAIFKISAENLNTDDNEIPVAINKNDVTYLYLNGKMEMIVPNGEVPDFHVFVIRENDRVDPNSIRKISFASISQPKNDIIFLSPEYDNISNNDNRKIFASSNTFVDNNGIHPIVLESFKYFYSDSDISKLKAYQRDYIYYGIKSKDDKGYLNQNAKDYLNYFEVNPKAYFSFTLDADSKGNPRIQENVVTQRRTGLSTDELINRMWTKGAFEFRFNIVNGDNVLPSTVKIPLLPSELWDFNIDHSRKNGTFFRRSKNTYKIDPNKFTSKIIYLDRKIPFDKWDIKDNTIIKYVSVFEENRGVEKAVDDSYTFETTVEGKFTASGSKIGLGASATLDLGGEITKTNKKTVTKSIKKTYKVGDEVLANNYKIYFYDPVVVSKGNKVGLYVYDTGIIKFSVIPNFQ